MYLRGFYFGTLRRVRISSLREQRIPAAKANHTLRFDSSLASATPTTDGEAVYVPFWDGSNIIMAAYSVKGEKLWNRNLGPWVSEHGAGALGIAWSMTSSSAGPF